ncbi:cell envelope integrity protein CreD [Helicobacter sp. 23-1048]
MKSYTTKAIVLLGIVIVLCLPLALIYDMLNDRKKNEIVAIESIARSYGKEQQISTPYLVMPYIGTTANGRYLAGLAVIGAKEAQSSIDLKDKVKKRGIYRALVYEAQAQLSLHYDLEEFMQATKNRGFNISHLEYAQAYLYFRMDESAELKITNTKNNQILSFRTRKDNDNINFVVLPFAMDRDRQVDVALELEFKGSSSFTFIPMAESEKIHITSTWSNLSYTGLLPDEYAQNADSGAFYEVSKLPTYLNVDSLDVLMIHATNESYSDGRANYVGVNLLDSITQYRLIERSIKYGVLFVLLTLSLLFVCDVGTKKSLHILQYGIIGASLVAFYLLLLSLSEQIGFSLAYILAALCVIVPISLYSFGILGDKKFSIIVGGSLSAMYLVLFGILKIENYSLLLGSILVMTVLYAMMYFTRNLHRG